MTEQDQPFEEVLDDIGSSVHIFALLLVLIYVAIRDGVRRLKQLGREGGDDGNR